MKGVQVELCPYGQILQGPESEPLPASRAHQLAFSKITHIASGRLELESTGWGSALNCNGEKASRQLLPLCTCRPAVSACGRGPSVALLHVGSVRCMDNTNMVDTCLQHHFGSLWQNTYQVITSCLNLSERLHIDKSCACSTGVMVTLITANKMCCKVSAPLRAWQVYVCQVSST